MNKMDLIRKNMEARKEKTLDALSDNMIRAISASIPLAKIIPNPKNVAASEDSSEDVQRLADDIATVGLLHNLVVNKLSDDEYMLISGERRYKALTKLGWTHAPCVVYDHLPDAMFGVMTVLANIDAREYSAAKRLQLYQELDTQLRELKRLGIYRGGIGRGIAQMMGVGEKQIIKYRRLVEELSPEKLSEVTNINKTYQELIRTLPDEKTSPQVKFFDDVDHETQSDDCENSMKTSPEVNFFDDVDRDTQSNDFENSANTSPQVSAKDDADGAAPPIDLSTLTTEYEDFENPNIYESKLTIGEHVMDCIYGKMNGKYRLAIPNYRIAAEFPVDATVEAAEKEVFSAIGSASSYIPKDLRKFMAHEIVEFVITKISYNEGDYNHD